MQPFISDTYILRFGILNRVLHASSTPACGSTRLGRVYKGANFSEWGVCHVHDAVNMVCFNGALSIHCK